MSYTHIESPTPQEIDGYIRAAHEARARVIRGWVVAAAHWLAHPHFKAHTA